jgi:hippurate hydrolase
LGGPRAQRGGGRAEVNSVNGIFSEARSLLPAVVELRRRIHAHPELGLVLPETQRAVLESLEGLGLEVRTGGATSAVVATLAGGAGPGPTLLLRADMDALPLREDTDLPFRSRQEGAMHACGHDAHVAMLAGAARLLAGRRDQLRGNLKLLFQPGEEGHAGARVLLEEGLLEEAPQVEAAFAIHVNPTLPSGALATRPGALLAAGDVFSIDLRGRGGHAAQPHDALDPIPVACEIVSAIQTLVTRRLHAFDPVVVSVTRLRAGTNANIIPDSASLLGTIRSVSDRARQRVHEKLEQLVRGIAEAHGIKAKIHLIRGSPVTVNAGGFTAFAQQVAGQLLGEDRLIELAAPEMGAEDFSYILQRVPGAMVFLGARPGDGPAQPLHSNRMLLDEDALATGVALHAAVALGFAERARPGPRAPGAAAPGGPAARPRERSSARGAPGAIE